MEKKTLEKHKGHKLSIVTYENPVWNIDDKKPICKNISLECETCNSVLIDFDY